MLATYYTPETYQKLISDVFHYGEVENHRNEQTLVLPAILFMASQGKLVTRKGFNLKLAQVEGLCLLSGYTDRDAIELAAPKTYAAGYFDGPNVEYGEMYSLQVEVALTLGEQYSRRAIMFGADLTTPYIDMPCAPAIHLQHQAAYTNPLPENYKTLERNDGGKSLIVTVFQRSWDLLKGLPYNLTMWSMAAFVWARKCGIENYEVRFLCSNPHIYINDHIQGLSADAEMLQVNLEPLDLFPKERKPDHYREALDIWKSKQFGNTTFPSSTGTTLTRADFTPILACREIFPPA